MIPVGISAAPPADFLPEANFRIMEGIRHYIVENIRTARRYLKLCCPELRIDTISFYELNEHTDPTAASRFLDPLRHGEPMGMMSEAGCPGVADPGALMAMMAQKEGLRVIPLAGPSSILMSLMASGFNGQGFSFHGYLPIDKGEQTARIKALENEAIRHDMTQIFIETPYRNNKMLQTLCNILRPETMLCVAYSITDPEKESIISLPVREWMKRNITFDKAPAIFLIYHRQ